MTSPIFITETERSGTSPHISKGGSLSVEYTVGAYVWAFALCVFVLTFSASVAAQRLALLSPDKTDASKNFAEKLKTSLADKFRMADDSMSEAAFASIKAEDPFNLTTETSKNIATAMGCDFFLLVRSSTQRRSASKRAEYYESYAVIYAVSARTGRLVFWNLPRFEAAMPQESERQLSDAVTNIASEIDSRLKNAAKSELTEPRLAEMEMPPDEVVPLAKNFRAPIPYKRIKPEYTPDAFLYEITATVDIIVDLDARGSILRTEIVRWAGYGLDESVEKAVRAMNWRSAERGGKTLPMRFLLRYNFKKIDKEQK